MAQGEAVSQGLEAPHNWGLSGSLRSEMGPKLDDHYRKTELFSLLSSQSAEFFYFIAIEERQRQIWYGKFHSK